MYQRLLGRAVWEFCIESAIGRDHFFGKTKYFPSVCQWTTQGEFFSLSRSSVSIQSEKDLEGLGTNNDFSFDGFRIRSRKDDGVNLAQDQPKESS